MNSPEKQTTCDFYDTEVSVMRGLPSGKFERDTAHEDLAVRGWGSRAGAGGGSA